MLASPFQAGKRVLRIDKKIRLMSVSEKPAHLPLPKPDINLINLLSVGFCLFCTCTHMKEISQQYTHLHFNLFNWPLANTQ